MEFSDYLKKLLRTKDLSKAELGRRIGKTQPYVYHLCRGLKPAPKPDLMSRIAKALEASRDEAQKLMDFSYQRILGRYAKFFEGKSGLEFLSAVSPAPEIPILSWVSAAKFTDVTHQDARDGGEGRVHTESNGKGLFALKVKNNCMEPEFLDGDIIVVDPNAGWNSGDYVVARLNHDDEATFKQLKVYKSKIVLHPISPYFDDIKFSKKDFDKQVTIIGKVVEKKKRY